MGASRAYTQASSSYIDYGDTTIVDGATSLTMAAWIKPGSLSVANCPMFSKGSFTDGAFYNYWDNDGGDYHFFFIRDGGGTSVIYRSSDAVSSLYSTGTWYWVVITWATPSTFTFHVNATSKSVTSYSAGSPTSIGNVTATMRTGRFSTGPTVSLEGSMAYNALYSAVVSLAQIQELMYNPYCVFSNAKFMAPGTKATGTNELDVVSGLSGTPSNATSSADGPPIFMLGGQ